MNEVRKQSLILSINDFIDTVNHKIDEQEFIEQKDLEDLLQQTICRDRDYMINVLQNDIENIQKEIKKDIKKRSRLGQNYAITVNQIALENQKIRRKIKEKNQLLVSKNNLKERKKIVQDLYDQIFFWSSQFQKTILEIKDKKSEIRNEIKSLRAEFAAISSNNLIILRHTNINLKMEYENFEKVQMYQNEVNFIKNKEKFKRKISKYANKNAEFDDSFKEIIDILGKYALYPKYLLSDHKKKIFEEQIAQKIEDDYPDSKQIAESLREKCDLVFTNKDNEINEILKKMEIKELHIKEKLRLSILNCGIQNAQNSNSSLNLTRYSPRYSQIYSPRFSPRRDQVDLLINHKSLKFASWEESSKLLNQTFDEIERLRQSRLDMNSDFNLNDTIE